MATTSLAELFYRIILQDVYNAAPEVLLLAAAALFVVVKKPVVFGSMEN